MFLLACAIENDKRPAGPTVSRSQIRKQEVVAAGGGSLVASGWLQCDCESLDEVSTDKVRGLMDGQSRELDVRMDEGRGGI